MLSIRLIMKFRLYSFLTWLLIAISESNIIGSIFTLLGSIVLSSLRLLNENYYIEILWIIIRSIILILISIRSIFLLYGLD